MQKSRVTTLGYELTRGQQEIVGAVLDTSILRLIISCMTRYGKTRAVAIALLLYIQNNPAQKPRRVLIVAPTIDQTNIIRNYIAEHIAGNQTLADLVDKPSHATTSRLKSEVSKKRITFKNNWELLTLTAHGAGEEPGKQLMGFGGDIVVTDEACLILDEVYRKRISRMLGDKPDSKLIVIVNPWNKLNFAYRAWLNPLFRKIHIDWRQALREGRVTETYLQEQRETLTSYEWSVLYESDFSDEAEDCLIRYDWIERAIKTEIVFKSGTHKLWGLDVAEHGRDLTILTEAETDGVRYKVAPQQWLKDMETMATANHVAKIVPKNENLNVDSIGVGAGVYSRLKELKHKAISVRVSEAPRRNPSLPKTTTQDADRYLNLKAQRYWELRTLFEMGLISIPNDPTLISQLSQMRYEFTPAGKIKIIDPEKSPDYADSLMLIIQEHYKLKAWKFG